MRFSLARALEASRLRRVFSLVSGIFRLFFFFVFFSKLVDHYTIATRKFRHGIAFPP